MENTDAVLDSSLCTACLCVGRKLRKITDAKQRQYYMDILKDIPLTSVLVRVPSICWECSATLSNAMSFREQVQNSYRILHTYTEENLHNSILTEISRPPRLKIIKNEPIDIVSEVPLALDCNVKEEIKTEHDIYSEASERKKEEPLSLKKNNQKIHQISWTQSKRNKINKNGNRKKNSGCDKSEIADVNNDSIDNAILDEEFNNETYSNEDATALMLNGDAPLVHVKKMRNHKISKKLRKRNRSLKGHKNKKISNQKLRKPNNIIKVELSHEEILSELSAKRNSKSYVLSPYKCEICVMGFECADSHSSHLASYHALESSDYICPICRMVLPSLESLNSHQEKHKIRFECSICHKRMAEEKSVSHHQHSHNTAASKLYKCEECGHISSTVDSHKYHKGIHKGRVPCTDCDKTFTHRTALTNHRLTAHKCKLEYPCPVCVKMFRWKSSLKRHMEKHELEGKNSASAAYCAECDISFNSVSSFYRHMRNSLKHVSQDQLRFTCDDCKKRFADKTKLRDHIEEKHLHKSYKCQICHKPSKNRVGLDQHIRNVHKGRPNNKICHYCGKAFPTKVQLESHIRTHTGERPFICEYCPSTFSQPSNLYKHNRQVHLNIKPKRMSNKKTEQSKNSDLKVVKRSIEKMEDSAPTPLIFKYDINADFTVNPG